MEIFESSSVGGKEQQGKIDNRDNIMKKMLSNRYEDLMNEWLLGLWISNTYNNTRGLLELWK